MRIEIAYWDAKPLTTDRINAYDEWLEALLKRYGFRIEFRYFDAATGIRTLGIADEHSRHTSLEYH